MMPADSIMEYKDKNVASKGNAEEYIYGGWFLSAGDAARLETTARELLADVISPIKDKIVAECGHITHTFCLKNPSKQAEVEQFLSSAPAERTIDLVGIAYKTWEEDGKTHFISAVVPQTGVPDLSTNSHPHITALRLGSTSPVLSNNMLGSEDHAFIPFPESLSFTFHAGVVLMMKKV